MIDEVQITDEEIRIKQRAIRGKDAYITSKAQLRLTRIANNVPYELFNQFVYKPLNNMRNVLQNGDWLDSYYDLIEIPTNPIFTEEMKVQYKLSIANEIVNGGLYPDFNNKQVDENGNII